MPRPRKPWWNERDGCYYTRLAGRQVPLRHEDGTKVARGDDRGVAQAVARLLTEQVEGLKRASDPTVGQLCELYLTAMSTELAPETLYAKEWVLKQFVAFGTPPYGDRPARSLDSTHLHAVRRAWERREYTGGMLRRLYREVLACWAWASRPEPERVPVVLLAANPLAKLRLPAGSPRRDRYVPVGTLRRLIDYAAARGETLGPLRARFEQQTVLLLRLLVETGCRPKEACEARWADFDAADGTITLPPARHKSGRKTGRERVIMMTGALALELAALRDSGHAHPVHLFAHARGQGEASKTAHRETGIPWQRPSLSTWFACRVREARAAGIELPAGLSIYWIRHSFVTDAQMAIGSERAADLSGHTKEVSVSDYRHAQGAMRREAFDRVARAREEEKEAGPESQGHDREPG